MPDRKTLDQSIAAALTARGVRFEAKKMMGGLAFMVDEKMCMGTAKQKLMVRFDPALHDEVLARPGAGPMDFTGKPMRGYVFVEAEALQATGALASWIDLALAFNPRAKRTKSERLLRGAERAKPPAKLHAGAWASRSSGPMPLAAFSAANPT